MNRHDHAPSRSARKRESQALQELGERLVGLKDADLARIPLPEELATAVHLARHIKERGGHRRQLQYIGKLMRRIDTTAIESALLAIDTGQHEEAHALHQVEHWRDRLLKEGAAGVAALAAEYPHVDTAKLTTLVHAAADTAGKSPRAARELFRYLRDDVFGKTR